MKKYEIQEKIGDGAYGLVFKAKDKFSGEILAVKQLKKVCKDFKELYNLREIKTLYFLNRQKCENIVGLKNVVRETNGTTFIIFDYSDQCLRNLIDNNEKNRVLFEEDSIKKIVYQVCLGVEFIHKMGFFHRDIKPDNILITDNSIVKITDFGFAIKNKYFNFNDKNNFIFNRNPFDNKNETYLNLQQKNKNYINSNYTNNNYLNTLSNNINSLNTFSNSNNFNYDGTKTEEFKSDLPNNDFFVKFKNYNKREFDNYLTDKPKNLNDKYTDYMCTTYYRPPECLFKSNTYGIEIDIWAIGTLLAEMYLSKPLFEANSDQELFYQCCQIMGTPSKSIWLQGYEKLEKLNIQPKNEEKKNIFDVIPNITESAADLLMKILVWDPKRRLNITEILEHPYFSDIKDRKFYKKLGLGKRYTLPTRHLREAASPRNPIKINYSSESHKKMKNKVVENLSNIHQIQAEKLSVDSIFNDSFKGDKADVKGQEQENNQACLNFDHAFNSIDKINNEKELDLEELKHNYLMKTENIANQKTHGNYINDGAFIVNGHNKSPANIINHIKENNLKNFNNKILDKDNNKLIKELAQEKIFIEKLENKANVSKNILAFSQKKRKKILKITNAINKNINTDAKENNNNVEKENPNKLSLFTDNDIKTKFDNFYEFGKESSSPIRKKNLYNVNIANTKSPRYIPIIVNRPVDAFKGNFLNDFHKNTIKFPTDKRNNSNINYSDQPQNSAVFSKNIDFNTINILTFNNNDKEKDLFKFPEQLPILISPSYKKSKASSDLNSNKNKSDEITMKNFDNIVKINESNNL